MTGKSDHAQSSFRYEGRAISAMGCGLYHRVWCVDLEVAGGEVMIR
jgi:hypothetical protein